jgi:hypothetical protein
MDLVRYVVMWPGGGAMPIRGSRDGRELLPLPFDICR